MKINQAFLRGFTGDGDKLCTPLTIVGDENSITLTKGEGFDEWLADDTKIVLNDAETTYTAQNQEMLRRIVAAWLHGEEFEG
jgi:hypothetical protein